MDSWLTLIFEVLHFIIRFIEGSFLLINLIFMKMRLRNFNLSTHDDYYSMFHFYAKKLSVPEAARLPYYLLELQDVIPESIYDFRLLESVNSLASSIVQMLMPMQ